MADLDLAAVLAANLRRGAFPDDNADELADLLDALTARVREAEERLRHIGSHACCNHLTTARAEVAKWRERADARQQEAEEAEADLAEARDEASQSRRAIDSYVEALGIERAEVARLRAQVDAVTALVAVPSAASPAAIRAALATGAES